MDTQPDRAVGDAVLEIYFIRVGGVAASAIHGYGE
jgi:hypothetical protein